MTNPTHAQPSDSFTAYGLTDEEFNALQGVSDTLFMLSNNQNPNDKQAMRVSNCLDLLWRQMSEVLDCKGAAKRTKNNKP